MIITTVNGTKFQIDTVNKTWERIAKTGDSGALRSEYGVYLELHAVEVGKSLVMSCPPYNPEVGIPRAIITSPIREIEY
jgi:hypothetical protein